MTAPHPFPFRIREGPTEEKPLLTSPPEFRALSRGITLETDQSLSPNTRLVTGCGSRAHDFTSEC